MALIQAHLAVGDFNGDGKPDLIFGNLLTPEIPQKYSSQLYMMAGNGDGSFQTAVELSNVNGEIGAAIAVGDFNGDGNADIFNPPNVYLGSRGRNVSASHEPREFGPHSAIATGDFNADGITDVATVDLSGTAVNVQLGTGSGILECGQLYRSDRYRRFDHLRPGR